MIQCTNFDFDCVSGPDPTGEAYSAPQDHLLGLEESYF